MLNKLRINDSMKKKYPTSRARRETNVWKRKKREFGAKNLPCILATDYSIFL